MAYTYDWPHPAVTTDFVVLTGEEGSRSILLIRRKGDPFAGDWALPGGFLEQHETIEAGAVRELKEETGLTIPPDQGRCWQIGAYGDPGRDPRGWTISIAFRADVDAADVDLTAGDDAMEVGWFAIEALPVLAFDHDRIIADALSATRRA